MWQVLQIYAVGGKVLVDINRFVEHNSACVRVSEDVTCCFIVKNGLTQGCGMSLWLFNIYIDGVVRKVFEKAQLGVKLVF